MHRPLADDAEDGWDEMGEDVAGFVMEVCPAVEAERDGFGFRAVAGEDEFVRLVPCWCLVEGEKLARLRRWHFFCRCPYCQGKCPFHHFSSQDHVWVSQGIFKGACMYGYSRYRLTCLENKLVSLEESQVWYLENPSLKKSGWLGAHLAGDPSRLTGRIRTATERIPVVGDKKSSLFCVLQPIHYLVAADYSIGRKLKPLNRKSDMSLHDLAFSFRGGHQYADKYLSVHVNVFSLCSANNFIRRSRHALSFHPETHPAAPCTA